MVAKYRRKIKTGAEYNHLISQSNGGYNRRKQFADTDDTIALIKNVVFSTLNQTAKLANALRGKDLKTTCQNIWDFVYWHVQYEKDSPGHEEIRHPARTWADRTRGVDCDDYSVFISSVLTNLKIPHALRVTAYKGDWQHIYVVVPKNGNPENLTQDRRNEYITIDCVPDHFDYEERYSRKQDTAMTLNELSGLDDSPMYGLAGRTQRQARRVERLANTKLGEDSLKKRQTKVGRFLQKASRGVKKVAASPVRVAWLTAMKLNLFGIASKLRFAYFPYEKGAQKIGYTRAQYDQLVQQTKKTQNVFVGAGGDSSALKNAILKGKGNSKNPLSGLGDLGVAAAASVAVILPALKALSAALTAIKPGVQAIQSMRNSSGGTSEISEDVMEEAAPEETEPMEGLLFGGKNSQANKTKRVEKRTAKKTAKTAKQAEAQNRLIAVANNAKAKQAAGQPLTRQETKLLQKAEPKKTLKEKIVAAKDKVFGDKATRQANKAKRVEKREAKGGGLIKRTVANIKTKQAAKKEAKAQAKANGLSAKRGRELAKQAKALAAEKRKAVLAKDPAKIADIEQKQRELANQISVEAQNTKAENARIDAEFEENDIKSNLIVNTGQKSPGQLAPKTPSLIPGTNIPFFKPTTEPIVGGVWTMDSDSSPELEAKTAKTRQKPDLAAVKAAQSRKAEATKVVEEDSEQKQEKPPAGQVVLPSLIPGTNLPFFNPAKAPVSTGETEVKEADKITPPKDPAEEDNTLLYVGGGVVALGLLAAAMSGGGSRTGRGLRGLSGSPQKPKAAPKPKGKAPKKRAKKQFKAVDF